MSTAREEILGRIRAAVRDAPDPAGAVEAPRGYRRSLPPGVDLPALFAERVADYRATVRQASVADLAAAIAESCAAREPPRMVVPADLPAGWLPPGLLPAGQLPPGSRPVEIVRDEGDLAPQDLDRMGGVVTGCAVGIAETGTIVLDHGAGQGRRALSLVPDFHLCVVYVDQVVGTVPEAVERLEPGRPHTWISGPSATSDIELNRVEGVHGPRTLEVLLVDP